MQKDEILKYYVVADTHGYYNEMVEALTEKGYYADTTPHKLIMCGDLFDRGSQNKEIEKFVLDLLDRNEVILIRGNHEDLLVSFVETLPSMGELDIKYSHDQTNGTVDTVRQIIGASMNKMVLYPDHVSQQMKQSGVFTRILPAMRNYYETAKYIFVHGWIPSDASGFGGRGLWFHYKADWREDDAAGWAYARWYNGMLAAHLGDIEPGKTIVCGHWHASYGHANFEEKGTEFGKDADFSPYYGEGIIALDACTIHSKKVNCIVIEDDELPDNQPNKTEKEQQRTRED